MTTSEVTQVITLRTSSLVHALNERHHLAWCGIRPQYRHWIRNGTAEEVNCPKCLTALRRGTPRSWGSKR